MTPKSLANIEQAQNNFKDFLEKVAARSPNGVEKNHYCRYLSMQYNLVRGVQKHFYRLAANPDVRQYKALPSFLLSFADEEELHYKIAEQDLLALNAKPLPPNLDVKLWWLYFDSVIDSRPFVRLGATCILENIAAKSDNLIMSLIKNSTYLNLDNTKFIQVHRHQENDHGNNIIEIINGSDLKSTHVVDLEEGTDVASKFFMRFMGWSFEMVPPNLAF
jgi:hypothetical protein